ncbi:MAG: SDR family oxidoreductase [Desulfomonile tiedjei]|nr:SDR family oxidoreductase [Desulfomonile tiedjei]
MKDKKTILITGAASGIGRETALLFARKGWFVGLLDISEEGLKSLRAEIGDCNCHAQYMDVADPVSVQEAVDAFAQLTGGSMHVLFNNAGVISFGRFDNVDIAKQLRTVDVNLKGVLNCTYMALRYLKATPGARIINMASTSAMYGVPDLSVYSATKHAMCALTEAWDIEFEQYDVTVSDILAPYVRTPLLDVPDTVYSIEKMGVKIEPETVAKTVWKAVHGKRLHRKMGISTYLLNALFWAAPFLRRPVVKSLTMPPD